MEREFLPVDGRKRIVFDRGDGIMQILGTSDDFGGRGVPIAARNFVSLGDPVPFASVARVTPRAVFYREPLSPADYTFNEAQR